MAWPPRTAEYEAAVHAAGKVFISQLPANTNLGPTVAGAPGARTPWRAGAKPVYELAPFAVRVEMGFKEALDSWVAIDGKHAVALDEVITPLAEATGLDHGVVGVVAKTLGIPLSLLILVLIFVGYLMLRNIGAVPPLSRVIQ